MGVTIHLGGGHRHRPSRHHRDYHRRHHRGNHRRHHRGGDGAFSGSTGFLLLWGIFVITGIFLIVIGLIGFIGSKGTKDFVEIKGRVVDYHTTYDYESGYMDAIIAEYVVDGVRYEIQSSHYSNHPKRIGSSVKINYNPLNPKDAEFASNTTKGNLIKVIAGGASVLVGGIGLVCVSKKDKSDDIKNI